MIIKSGLKLVDRQLCGYLLLLLSRLLPWRHHARPGDGLEELLYFRGAGDELVLPELEAGVLDELDEGDEEAPRVRPVHDQPLQEDARDLLLDGLGVGLGEEVEQRAGEVVRVRVGVAQLVGDAVEEVVAALRLQVDRQVLEDVHVGGVADGAHVGGGALGADELDGRGAHVHHQRVDQLIHAKVNNQLKVHKLRNDLDIEHLCSFST